MTHLHPKRGEDGQPVTILEPCVPSDSSTWFKPDACATAIPGGTIPEKLNNVPLCAWTDAPVDNDGWERLAQHCQVPEPPFHPATGKAAASGAVIIEPDGRIWIVSPTNRFDGNPHTFPKGKVDIDAPLSLKANALKEVYEESGLQIEIQGFLTDADRSTSRTRYYVGRRINGSPADMGWESQAVSLVPRTHLPDLLKNPGDQIVLAALAAL